MKKKIILFLCFLIFISSFANLYARNMVDQYKKSAEELKSYNIIQGDASGDLMLDKNLKREDLIIILSRLMNDEERAKKYSTHMSACYFLHKKGQALYSLTKIIYYFFKFKTFNRLSVEPFFGVFNALVVIRAISPRLR